MTSVKKSVYLNWMVPTAKCWVEVPETEKSNECFRPAIIIEGLDSTKTKLKVKYIAENKASEEVKMSSVSERAEEKKESVEDMVNMECLNDAELLINLQKRFEDRMIFTYVGPTLLIVNPYQLFPDLFSAQNLAKYHNFVFRPEMQLKDLPPHIWALTGEAYRSLFEMERNQALVISGESGAGKTENTKYAMKFLTSLGKLENRRASARKSIILDPAQVSLGDKKNEGSIEEKILSCNPILEAFGNAKTVRNDNSSRFGKYVRMLVNKKNRTILGARMDNYLLEKSRITSQGKGERNYHIFYHLMKGATNEEMAKLSLMKNGKRVEMSSFEYLNKSECYDVPNINDEQLYQEVRESFQTMHFTPEEENAIWSIVSAVLYIGNIQIDDSTYDNDKPCSLQNKEALQTASGLLRVNFETLEKSFLVKTREVGKQLIESPMQKVDCEFARETLAKDLFEKLFVWLVKKLNYTIMPEEDLKSNLDVAQVESSRFTIGLLDIFGFEILKINSLEQFCINYTNEKLQQLYISYVFKAEEKEFTNEGLEKFIVDLNFKDNQPVIDLLDSYPMGIYHLLDESCAIAGTDDGLIQKIRNTHKANSKFSIPKLTSNSFIIVHTAKNVEYTITGFRTKNKDEMSKIMIDTLHSSAFEEFVKIFKGITGDKEIPGKENVIKDKKASDKFLGAKFRQQMKDLMSELTSCDCHFIRCIKPNEQKQKGLWVPLLALTQIRYLGVLDSIKVRKDSFPVRRVYRLFYQKYGEMDKSKYSIPKLIEMKADFRELTISMFKNFFPELGNDLVLFGKTKLFMRTPALNIIEKKFNEKMKEKHVAVRKIQKAFYRYEKRKQLRRVLNGIRRIQDLWRCRMEYKNFKETKIKIRTLQAFLHKKYLKKQAKNYRLYCIQIQKYFRRYHDFSIYLTVKSKIQKMQNLIRGALARIRVRKIRFCREIVLRSLIFPAFNMVLQSKATKIQKLARGYITKCRNFKIVCQARRVKRTLMESKAIRKIQKIGRGYIVRQRLQRLNRAAFYIQGYFKMKWLSSLVKGLRKAALVIQRNVRIFINRRCAIRKRINSFLENHTSHFEDLVNNEKGALFQGEERSNGYGIDDFDDKRDRDDGYLLNNVREVAPYDKKIQLFSFIFDIDIMVDTSDIYDSYWSSHYKNTLQELSQTDSDIQYLQLGSAHTIAISSNPHKIYSWGWNDYFQLGRESEFPSKTSQSFSQVHLPYSGLKIRTASCGEDHNFLLDYDNNLWCWGLNNKGQLGLGHKTNIEYPIRAELVPKALKIKEIKSKYHNNCLVTECGKAFIWPKQKQDDEFVLRPTELFFPPKTLIWTVSCGFNFSCFLTINGLIYTMGQENSHGQLGLGDINGRNTPTLIESLKNAGEKISTIECGFAHVIAKSSLGKVFTWGWGEKGQLGHGRFVNELAPRLVYFHSVLKTKVLQIQAGYKCSIVLLENKKLLWWGSNGSILQVNTPRELNLNSKNKNMSNPEFNPVRILASWSKNLSILYATVADTRATNLSQGAKHKILNTLHSKWEEVSLSEIDPPFIESISKYFSVKNMKLKRTVSVIKIQPKYPQNFLMTTPNFVDQPNDSEMSENSENNEQIQIENNNNNNNNKHKSSYEDVSEKVDFNTYQETNEGKNQKNSLMPYESPDFMQRNSQNAFPDERKIEHFEIKVQQRNKEEEEVKEKPSLKSEKRLSKKDSTVKVNINEKDNLIELEKNIRTSFKEDINEKGRMLRSSIKEEGNLIKQDRYSLKSEKRASKDGLTMRASISEKQEFHEPGKIIRFSMKEDMHESGRMLRSSLKEGGILKSKEENSNLSKEKQRSNSKVSFFLEEKSDRGSKSKISLVSEQDKQEFKENNALDEKKDNETVMTEELEKKLRTIKSKLKSILHKKKDEWTDLDWQFYNIANEPKMQSLLLQIK